MSTQAVEQAAHRIREHNFFIGMEVMVRTAKINDSDE